MTAWDDHTWWWSTASWSVLDIRPLRGVNALDKVSLSGLRDGEVVAMGPNGQESRRC